MQLAMQRTSLSRAECMASKNTERVKKKVSQHNFCDGEGKKRQPRDVTFKTEEQRDVKLMTEEQDASESRGVTSTS